jgi:ubiquinol-cytochrome c reductase cytochrome b subunit
MNAGKPFYPDQLFEDGVAILILFSVLVVMALFVPVPTEEIADPTDASYDPRPEWYFLFLFQLLKYFEGRLEVIGTFVIPTVAILLLFLVPFLGRKERLPLRKRPVALAITSLSVLSLVSLTILGMRSPRLNSTATTVSGAEQSDASTLAETEVFDFGLEEEN